MWGQRIWQARPISYQAQRPRRGGRNVRGRMKKVQIAKRKKPPQASQAKRTNTVRQPWEHGGGAIPGETVTSVLNAHN